MFTSCFILTHEKFSDFVVSSKSWNDTFLESLNKDVGIFSTFRQQENNQNRSGLHENRRTIVVVDL